MKVINLKTKLTNSAINHIAIHLGITTTYKYPYNIVDLLEKIFDNKEADFYFQNSTRENDEETKITMILASDTNNVNNNRIIKLCKDKILAIEGVNVEDDSFLIIRIRLLPKSIGVESSKSIKKVIKFSQVGDIKAIGMPKEIIREVERLQNAEEIYIKVDRNIKDWDEYLSIIEREAKESQLIIEYKAYTQKEDLTQCVFIFNKFTSEEIGKLKKFRSEFVKLICSDEKRITKEKYLREVDGESDEIDYVKRTIGVIDKINYKNNTITINLDLDYQEQALEGNLNLPNKGVIEISKLGDLAQARRLRKGLKILKNGEGNNPDLDVILFNSNKLKDTVEGTEILRDDDLLLKTLNTKQKEAVEGVINSKDIYLIQGPPGTGKTTVIAEICYQNAIRGKKTLISSQSNLAVDNALSRLGNNPKMRIFRAGNIASIEKEGKKFTADKVVETWLNNTADICKERASEKSKRVDELNELYSNVELVENLFKEFLQLCEDDKKVEEDCKLLKDEIKRQSSEKSYNIDFLKTKIGGLSYDNKWVIYNSYATITEKICEISRLNRKENYSKNQQLLNLNLEKFEEDLKYVYLKIRRIKELQEKIDIFDLIEVEIKKSEISKVKEIMKAKEVKFSLDFNNILENIKKNYSNFLCIKNEIEDKQQLAEIVNKNINILIDLKEVYKINNMIAVEENFDYAIDKSVVKEYEKNVARLYSFKPNKIIALMGIKKEWKYEIINTIKLGEIYLEKIYNDKNELDKKYMNFKDLEMVYINKAIEECKILSSKINVDKENEFNKIDEKMKQIIQEKELVLKDIVSVEEDINKEIFRLEELLEEKNAKFEIINNRKLEIREYINDYNNKFLQVVKVKITGNTLLDEYNRTKGESVRDVYLSCFGEERNYLNNYMSIINQWTKKIKSKNYGDKVELNNLYVNAANVIGITCVQSGGPKFTNNYPDFDMVIVDEVSKATPPELVLPMLKGKKMVLVGDHKQLPPMIGSETFEELKRKSLEVDANDIVELEVAATCESDELDYMKSSLFEELFNGINPTNKIMLDTQYRMHSSIMETINQFYKEGDNEGLKCGIKNEKQVKNHGLDLGYINTTNNLVWVDIPLHQNFYEKVNNNSFYNETEVEVIEKLLLDINEECIRNNTTKEIAVITFYGAQARLLQRKIIVKDKYKNLKIRVGTVDKFQGMEREIVIVSFVRNNPKRNVGFARDPKRINVALSRAQNLLVIVGCSELFCEKNYVESARDIYRKVLKTVNYYNGVIDAGDIFK